MAVLRKGLLNKIALGIGVVVVLFLVVHNSGKTPHQAVSGKNIVWHEHEKDQHDGVPKTPLTVAPEIGHKQDGDKHIAVLITVTKDMTQMDGAAVLAESVRLMHSRYRVDLVAVIHPNITTSRDPLRKIGYRLIERNIPVDFDKLPEVYRKEVLKGGCCGIYELLKLEALTLMEYDKVLAVDLDTVFLRNIDELFDSDKVLQYTEDIGMDSNHFNRFPPTQGGFLLFSPNMKAYNDLVAIARKADWKPGGGWEGLRIGFHWGGTTIQGMLPYYFRMKAPVEWHKVVDRCLYNNMADLNCTQMPFDQVKSVHFTLCQKPWSCIRVGDHLHNMNMCRYFHDRWWDIRDKLQERLGLYQPPTKDERCPRSGYPPLKEFPLGPAIKH